MVDFLFSQTDLRVFESASGLGQELAEFTSARDLGRHFSRGADRHGNGFAVLLQLWSPSVMADLDIERIALDPKKCDGHTFRYTVRGGGLIQLYFGGVYQKVITKSHYGHNSQKRA